jgi:hypothetical protein
MFHHILIFRMHRRRQLIAMGYRGYTIACAVATISDVIRQLRVFDAIGYTFDVGHVPTIHERIMMQVVTQK